MREGAHVAGALHVVLAAQRIHADAVAADIAGGHGEVGHAHHHRRTLAVLGDAEAVVDGGIRRSGIEAGGGAEFGGRHAGELLGGLGRILFSRDEARPRLEIVEVAAFAHECLVHQALGDDDMGQRIDEGDVGAGLELQVVGGADVRRLHEVDAARIGDDECSPLAQTALHARGEDRMAVRGVGADHQDDVGLGHRLEILGAGRGAEGGLEAVAGGGVADAGAGVDVVVAQRRAHQLLHQEHFLVGAARRGDAADGVAAVAGLDAPELGRRVGDGLAPRRPRARGR